jgi:rfaE bifunctional protein kinase chain/domain
VIGDDDMGTVFLNLLRKEKIESNGILTSPRRITTTKFRIFGNNTQMLRVDEETENDLSEHDMNALMERIESIITREKIACIIFQDYNKGVIAPGLIQRVIGLAKEKNIPITVDPKKRNFDSYSGVTLFKPNLKELKEGLKTDFSPDDREGLMRAAQLLRNRLNCDYVMTTMSEHGVMISMKDKTDEKNIFIPAHLRSVADVSGAGDTVISVASLCLALNRSPYEIAYISNLAGGLVCEDTGIVPVNKNKLLKEILALL